MAEEQRKPDQAWPNVVAALAAAIAGDGEGFDLHMAVGGPEAVRTLGALAAALHNRCCKLEAEREGMPDGGGTPEEWLDSLREVVMQRERGEGPATA